MTTKFTINIMRYVNKNHQLMLRNANLLINFYLLSEKFIVFIHKFLLYLPFFLVENSNYLIIDQDNNLKEKIISIFCKYSLSI